LGTAPKATPTPIPVFVAGAESLTTYDHCPDDVRFGEVIEVDDIETDNVVDGE